MADSAPSPASSGAPASAPASKSPVSGGGQVFDAAEAFKSTKGELDQTRGALERVAKEFGGFKKQAQGDSETLKKIRDVFAPTEQKGPDPVADAEAQLDYYLAQAYEMDKQGTPIPLTMNLAMRHFQQEIANHKEKGELQKQLKELGETVKALSDPQRQINTQAYGNFDNYLIQGLDSLYGVGDETNAQKASQFDAISRQLSSVVKSLQKDEPDSWDKIRRSPEMQRKLVNNVLKQNLPPQAVRMIEQENLKNTPMSEKELWAAFREAGEITDDRERREIRSQIRGELLSIMANRHNRRAPQR